jgi:hypothetical protein
MSFFLFYFSSHILIFKLKFCVMVDDVIPYVKKSWFIFKMFLV